MEKYKDPTILLSLMSKKLRAAYNVIRKRLNSIGFEDLDISHGDILYQLYFNGALPMKELALRINRDKSTVTALVRKLLRLDMICKESDPSDGRVINITLTRKGEGFREEFMDISDSLFRYLYRGFSREDKQGLVTLLSRLGEE